MLFALGHHLGRPDGHLHLADVRLFQHQHTQTALSDTAADGQGQSATGNTLMIGVLHPILSVRRFKLARQGVRVHADAHGADLQRVTEDVVPQQQVAVEGPVVIVGGAAVVGLAAFQLVADAHQEHGAALAGDGVLPLLARQGGVAVCQLLSGDEGHLLADVGGEQGIFLLQQLVGVGNRFDDATHRLLQVLRGALFGGDHRLPVPLIHEDGVGVVHIVVAADGVHIGVDALTGAVAVATQRHALPFGERLHHLGVSLVQFFDRKGHLTLHTRQVVVDTAGGRHQHRGGDTL